MESNAQKNLEIISTHIQEHHAAVLVGAGFSRNAIKVTPDVPDSPLWGDLAKIFKERLASSTGELQEFEGVDPLKLAEYVEIQYGRQELDRLLISGIRDTDYKPSALHKKLLQLPWSDIFTTNYDTLLERTSEELTEKQFTYILSPKDLVGSAGSTRIIKLHGSFPSQRPFIITAEDYRTYPKQFAPFVNTVQQSLLENTLCLIGFSGDDPNFNSWVGWIHDNLGTQNAPNIYLLLHQQLSDTQQKWLRRKHIISVDLSEVFPSDQPAEVYENALNYLLENYHDSQKVQQKWPILPLTAAKPGKDLSIKDALLVLKKNHSSCPELLFMPVERLNYARRVIIFPASNILEEYCNSDSAQLDKENELEFLYEYNWLREKGMLPLMQQDLKYYEQILRRHEHETSEHKAELQISMLRAFREHGWHQQWQSLHKEILQRSDILKVNQKQRLHWEKCLFDFSQYQFEVLDQDLEDWEVLDNMTLWVLRKSSLLAESGKCELAHDLLEKAILNLRKQCLEQLRPNLFLLSVESAMMCLQGFISQAIDFRLSKNHKEKDSKERDDQFIDEQHMARHKQHYVSWSEQNAYFVPRLESLWKRSFGPERKRTFDFGMARVVTNHIENKDLVLAFTFLRFREETGIPFRVKNVYENKKAACGAAERIANIAPEMAILTLVRADEPKSVGDVLTRGVLSTWSVEKCDVRFQFYLDAIIRTEEFLLPSDWFYRKNFTRWAADVLPEVLSELCCKCSCTLLDKALNLLRTLYESPVKLCYQHALSITKRLPLAYPETERKNLILKFLCFPLPNLEDADSNIYYPEPLQFVPKCDKKREGDIEPLSAVDDLLDMTLSDYNRDAVVTRLLFCLSQDLLTKEQKQKLSNLLWQNQQFVVPTKGSAGWLRTTCLQLPHPEGIDLIMYLRDKIVADIQGYENEAHRPQNDCVLLEELTAFAIQYADAFTEEQVSRIVHIFRKRVKELSHNVSIGILEFVGLKKVTLAQLYGIARGLWVLTSSKKNWNPNEADQQSMADTLSVFKDLNLRYYGLENNWNKRLKVDFSSEQELKRCLLTADETCSLYNNNAIIIAANHYENQLLSDEEICAALLILSQQIAWCIPKYLKNALRVFKTVVSNQVSYITEEILEPVLSGLGQLLEQTVIEVDDSIDSAAEKGEIRKEAIALAKELDRKQLYGTSPETIQKWICISQDANEFADIRQD